MMMQAATLSWADISTGKEVHPMSEGCDAESGIKLAMMTYSNNSLRYS